MNKNKKMNLQRFAEGNYIGSKDASALIPEQVSDDDMVLMAREISKRIEDELEYPGQIKVNVIRESRVTDYAK